MNLPLFYVPFLEDSSSVINLPEDSSRHVSQVLRYREGDSIQLTNGKGLCVTAQLTVSNKRNSVVSVIERHHMPPPQKKIYIAISLLKNAGRFEWFLEKAVELGVSSIYLLLTDRTEKQHFRKERAQGIMISAMLQSQQSWLPEIEGPMTLHEFWKIFSGLERSNPSLNALFAHCMEGERKPLADCVQKGGHHLLFIGPEGDFTADELQDALGKGCKPVSLGDTRLRTETAAIAALSVVVLCT
jgi:16S rRNA (uracil1498-N3)-methyltransferase